jgi:predicted N-acetyltransferase YhbS
MDERTIEIVPPDPRKHRQALYDLFGKAFGRYTDLVAIARGGYFDAGYHDWRTSRACFVNGVMVSHIGVWDYRMRIGSAAVRCAGIGAVMTHGDYRRRGYAGRTMLAALDAMRQAGYDVSVLFGRKDLYHKYGYVRSWAPTTYTFDAGELPPPRRARLARFAPFSRLDADRLYNRAHAGFTGTAVRPTYRRRNRPEKRLGYAWEDRPGRCAGYVVVSPGDDELTVVEAAGGLDDVLAAIAAVARRQHARKIRLMTIPHDHPLAKWVRRGNSQAKIDYIRSGGAMVRDINLPAALRKIAPELAARLARSHMSAWRGRLLVKDAWDAAVLRIDKGSLAVDERKLPAPADAIRGGAEVAQLLIGTDRPDEIFDANRTKLTGAARELANVLFPEQHPVLSLLDKY